MRYSFVLRAFLTCPELYSFSRSYLQYLCLEIFSYAASVPCTPRDCEFQLVSSPSDSQGRYMSPGKGTWDVSSDLSQWLCAK